MKALFEKEYNLRSNDFDKNDNLHISAILDLFQTAASEHAILLDAGYESMKEKELIWVLTKIKFEIIKHPVRFETVTVKTWPLVPGRVSFIREYIVTDSSGNLLIKGSSEWVTVHMEKRKISPAGNVYDLGGEEFISDTVFGGRLKKVPAPDTTQLSYTFIPCYGDIDINHHMNNTKYANYIVSAIKNDITNIKEFQIDYHMEILPQEEINIFICAEENTIKFQGKNQNGILKFSAMINLE